jgi:hypothetical protein
MDVDIEILGNGISEESRRLFGRSLHIREVDPGSCNGCTISSGLAFISLLLHATPTACSSQVQ